jgi:hypothetical protein
MRLIFRLIVGLVILSVVLVIIGAVVKSLTWVAVVGVLLFIATGIYAAVRRRSLIRRI